jgi:WD40 repeat protein
VTDHDGIVTSVAFRPDGSTLATADKQNMVNLWRLGDRVTRTAKYPATEPWSAPISPDGRYLAFNLRKPDDHLDLQIVDLARPDAEPVSLRTGMRRWISEIAFGPDGTKLLATGREGLIDFKDLTEPDADQTFSVEGTWIWTVAFSPDGSAFASGADDKAVRLWYLNGTGAPSEIVGRHGESVRRIRFSPDGRQLASASDDWTIRLWDMVNRDLPPAVMSGHESAVWTLAFSPDGTMLASGGADGKILLWDLGHPLMQLATPGLVDAVCDRVWRNPTLEEWRIFVGENIAYEQTCPNLPNPEGAGR